MTSWLWRKMLQQTPLHSILLTDKITVASCILQSFILDIHK
jgi:hypothetical protein